MQDAGCRIHDSRIQDSGFSMQDSDSGFRIQDSEFWILDSGSMRFQDSGFRQRDSEGLGIEFIGTYTLPSKISSSG